MNRILTLIDSDKTALQNWYQAAMHDPTVMPYLSNNNYVAMHEIKSNAWENTLLMDNTNTGLAVIIPLRESMSHRAIISLWVLDTDRRLLIAGRLFQEIKTQAYRQGVKWLEWYVCEDNARSLAFSRKHAKQFSAQPEASWSFKESKWKTCFGFTLKIRG